jgi:hypothetical protein
MADGPQAPENASPIERLALLPDDAILGDGSTGGEVDHLPPTDNPEPDADTPEEAEEAEASEQPAPEEPDSQAEEEDDGDDSQETDDPDGDEDDDDKFPVKVNGEELEVTYEELTQGYQRWADYSRKTADLAEQRKAFEGEIKQARQNYSALLAEMNQALDAPDPDPALLDENSDKWDPDEFRRQEAQKKQVEIQRQWVHQRFAQLRAEVQQEEVQKLAASWEGVSRKDLQGIGSFLQSDYGFSPEEVGNLIDHRIILLAKDAMGSKAMKAKAPEVVKKLKAKPKVNKPKAKASDKSTLQARAKRARDRFSQTRHPRDAAAVILETEGLLD